MSARSRHGPAPWGRLRPVNVDPLESVGLPSKGDSRLLEFKAQESYYATIIERYLKFCSEAGRSDELLRQFSSLSLDSDLKEPESEPEPAKVSHASSSSTTRIEEQSRDPKQGLSVLVLALRKLREGIVASQRIDRFSIQVYLFCIRFSILTKQFESYHPALLYLLRRMHPVLALSKLELQEFVGYLVLDIACRQQDLMDAHVTRHFLQLKDLKVDAVLRSLVRGDYHLFWVTKKSVDGHKARIMDFADHRMRQHSLKCLGRTYLQLAKDDVEKITSSSWQVLLSDHKIGWQLQDQSVIIRKPKSKA